MFRLRSASRVCRLCRVHNANHITNSTILANAVYNFSNTFTRQESRLNELTSSRVDTDDAIKLFRGEQDRTMNLV